MTGLVPKGCCGTFLPLARTVCSVTPAPTLPLVHVSKIPSTARDDMNVAKKLMVSVATNPTPAIVCSDVASQVPHLKSLPVLSEWRQSTSENSVYSPDNRLLSAVVYVCESYSLRRFYAGTFSQMRLCCEIINNADQLRS